MADMPHPPEQEMKLITDILSFSHDPFAYIKYNFPWNQPNTPLQDHKGPRDWQAGIAKELSQHTKEQQFALDNDLQLDVYREAVKSGRGPGKSAFFAMLANWMLDTHIGSSVIVTANTERQLRSKTFSEFGKWFTMGMTAHWWNVEGMGVWPQDWLGKLVREQLKIDTKYWGASGQPWSEENPDAFAGTHNTYGLAVFFDEASGIPEPIWNVTAGFFTERTPFRYWLAFSNPRRNSGAFFNRFNKDDYASTWKHRTINVLEVEGVDHSVHESIIAENGPDSDAARVEVYGEFPEMGDRQLIPNSHVREAQKRDVRLIQNEDDPLIMGVDPAPRGRTVIRFRQGRDARSIPPEVLNGKDNTQIADRIVQLVNKYDPDGVAVDAGLGTGVIDELKRRRVRPVFEVWFGAAAMDQGGEFLTVGGELWGRMRDWLPGGCIDDSTTLFRDLTVRTWDWAGREDAKKTLTSKKEMAKDGIPSPDDGDALAVTFFPNMPRRNKRAFSTNDGGSFMAAGLDESLL